MALAGSQRSFQPRTCSGRRTSNPEYVLRDCKSYATRRLRERGMVDTEKTVWIRKGDKSFLMDDEAVRSAVDYTLNRQDGKRFEYGS